MDIFEELGLHRYINAQDTFTTYGASCMPAASLRAMREIASSCVELAEVQAKTGDALAKLTHNEGAYISNGAAGGMLVATAAALARDDEKIFHSLPEITGPRYEVVMQAAQRNMYDRGCSAVGAKMRYIGTADTAPTVEELEAAITPATTAVFYVIFFGRDASLPLETIVEVAHRHGVPVIVDAAAQNPPAENLWKFTGMGADLVIFSGGKTMRGPQDSGLIVGKKEWIDRCRRWGPPTDGACRGCKTSRESIVGLYKAVQLYLQRDEATLMRTLNRRCAAFERTLRDCGFIQITRTQEGPVGQVMARTYAVMPYGSAKRHLHRCGAGQPDSTQPVDGRACTGQNRVRNAGHLYATNQGGTVNHGCYGTTYGTAGHYPAADRLARQRRRGSRFGGRYAVHFCSLPGGRKRYPRLCRPCGR